MESLQQRQTFKSEYGRKGITVSTACPTFVLRRRLDRVHVGTPAGEVETMVREAVADQRVAGNAAWTDAAEAEAVRFALWQHGENVASYQWVMGSH